MFEFAGSVALGIILLIAGLVLSGVEMFVPGFSVPGICAVVCFIAGVVLCASTLWQAIVIIAALVVALTVMFIVIMRIFSNGRIKSPIQLKEASDGLSGSDLSGMLGARGTAVTDLHPVGSARFDAGEYEVISQGRYIPVGAELVVVKVSMNKLYVAPAEESPAEEVGE